MILERTYVKPSTYVNEQTAIRRLFSQDHKLEDAIIRVMQENKKLKKRIKRLERVV